MQVIYKLRMVRGRTLYRFGLTHQFNCRECGWPTLERPHLQYWQWYCPNCGWGVTQGWHTPRVMKRQHRIVGWLRLLWREVWG